MEQVTLLLEINKECKSCEFYEINHFTCGIVCSKHQITNKNNTCDDWELTKDFDEIEYDIEKYNVRVQRVDNVC